MFEYKKLLLMHCLLIGTITLLGCKKEINKNEILDVSNPSITWAKSTNFKLDFMDENSQIKNIKIMEKELTEIILTQVESGKLKAYDYVTGDLLSSEQIINIFHKKDTVIVTDPVTFEETRKPVTNDLDRANVKKMRVKQEWYWDEQALELKSKLIGVAPLLEVYGDDLKYRGDLPLFMVYFGDNHPPQK